MCSSESRKSSLAGNIQSDNSEIACIVRSISVMTRRTPCLPPHSVINAINSALQEGLWPSKGAWHENTTRAWLIFWIRVSLVNPLLPTMKVTNLPSRRTELQFKEYFVGPKSQGRTQLKLFSDIQISWAEKLAFVDTDRGICSRTHESTRQAGVDKRSLLTVNLFVDLCPIYLPLSWLDSYWILY